MLAEKKPALSVILPTPDDFETLRRTVAALRGQTILDRLELVVVAPTVEMSVDPAAVAGFFAVQVISVGPITSSNGARVAGIRAARAPIVVLAEDHCFPEPDWAASLLEAFEQGCAAVGPVLRNGNPRTALSWANFLAEYGHWIGQPAGEVDQLPGHNSAYRRELLLEYGADLVPLMEAETVMQEVLRKRGERLLLQPKARADHFNFSSFRSSVRLRFHGGRMFAGHRVRGWPWHRKLMYLIGSPLIPFIRVWRISRLLGNSDECRLPKWRLLPVVMGMLIIDGAGELVGYLIGPGRASAELSAIEFHREEHMIPSDRRAYFARAEQSSVEPSASAALSEMAGRS